jgi:hypothetical protein
VLYIASVKKAAPYILLLLMGIAVLFIKRCSDGKIENKEQVNRDRGFDRRASFLEYSKHATCRMDCRKITKSEVEAIMKEGRINYKKSDLQNARCPRYAIEGRTSDQQRVRIIFAQCNESTTVVTVIDLGTDWTCHCPGDDKKYENRN